MTEDTDPGRFGHGPVWWRGRRGLRRVWPGDGLGAAAGSRGREPPAGRHGLYDNGLRPATRPL